LELEQTEGTESNAKDLTQKPVVKKLIKATGAENYNILQNNGRIAHQEVDHVSSLLRVNIDCVTNLNFFKVHFHMVSQTGRSLFDLALISNRFQNQM
jgi:hypothetical protein